MPRLTRVTDAPDRKQAKPPGPAGRRVMERVKKLRLMSALTYKDLSGRLEALGRPIPVLGLSRMENGARKVDADDLVALALALGVTPNRLLLPDVDARSSASAHALTPAVKGRPQELWSWAQGEEPAETPLETLIDHDGPDDLRHAFIEENKPYLLNPAVTSGGGIPGRKASASPELEEKLGRALAGIQQALASGLSATEVRCAVELAITSTLLPSDPEGDH
jgi:transcriptional regulator with XRE-family HTH domain